MHRGLTHCLGSLRKGGLVERESEATGRLPQVVERWKMGDREGAYALVVEDTKDSLYRFLRHMLRDEEEARDVFQETYLRVFRALGKFRGEASLSTWVLTIGRNTALNRIRKQKGKESQEVSVEGPDDVLRSPAVPARETVATRSVLKALGGLPQAQREAVLLYYVEDRPLNEIAEVTGRTPNTIKSDLLRARKRLRQVLEPGVRGEG